MAPGRFRELMNKYGKVALGVHLSVSAASITGLYVAVKNNVDVESLFERVGLSSSCKQEQEQQKPDVNGSDPAAIVILDDYIESGGGAATQEKKSNRTAEMAASSGGALAVAVLLNKALFPVRVPITIALTPPISKFLARRNIIKSP